MLCCVALQVYLQPFQLADCLRDPDVLKMVQKAQLKLVLNEEFPEFFTICPPGSVNSTIVQVGDARRNGTIDSNITKRKVCQCSCVSLMIHRMPRDPAREGKR